jgi:hypothetical protein
MERKRIFREQIKATLFRCKKLIIRILKPWKNEGKYLLAEKLKQRII